MCHPDRTARNCRATDLCRGGAFRGGVTVFPLLAPFDTVLVSFDAALAERFVAFWDARFSPVFGRRGRNRDDMRIEWEGEQFRKSINRLTD